MAKLTFQKLDMRKNTVGGPFEVSYNPTEYTLTKSAQFAEVSIPGLDSPVVHFVRGESEKLNLELLFDSTENGTGTGARPVTTDVDKFYRLVKVDGDMHAPPIVRITWSDQFPGKTTDGNERPIPAFDCVVDSLSRRYTLFNSSGVPLRCIVTLQLREYKALEEQLQELNLRSADHTRVHMVRQDETLPQIAYAAYGDPARWRLIADHNKILNPRRLVPGTVLELPPTT
jgi:nucleoid-associated protein YgaU